MLVTIESNKGYYKVYGSYLRRLENELVVFKMKRVKKHYILPFYNLNKFLAFLRDRKFSFHIKNTPKPVQEIDVSNDFEDHSNIKRIVDRYYEHGRYSENNSCHIHTLGYVIKIFTFIYSILIAFIIYNNNRLN